MKHRICILLSLIIMVSFAFAVDDSGANIPELYQGLYPIKYSENGDVVFVSKNHSDWYNYTEGRWANAVTLDKQGQMNPSAATEDNITGYYVWIPRYAYLIRTGYNSSNTGRIDIRFLKGTTNSDINGNTYYTINDLDNESNKWEVMNTVTYMGDRQMEYLVHPAFYFEEELAGIWVGKYEASKGREREIELVNTIPNQTLWTGIDINSSFAETRKMISQSENYDKYNLYGLGEEVNTHLIKATEYGVIVYLENSIYKADEKYGVKGIIENKEYLSGGLEGATDIYLEKYYDIYEKDEEGNIKDIKGSAYLETSNGTTAWNGESISHIDETNNIKIKENQYGSIASSGIETDTGFRIVLTKGTNENSIKTIYQKDDSYYWLMQNGDVWVMGNNNEGELGIENMGYKYIPIKVEKDKAGNKMPQIEKIVCIEGKVYFIANNGDQYLNGNKNTDILDLTLDTITILPNLKKEQLEEYNNLEEIKAIYGNATSTIIEEKDGEVYAVGDNTNNKLGISEIANITTPTKISIKNIKDVGIGSDFSVFLKDNGTIVGYGNTSKNGNGLTGITQIAVQDNKAYFMRSDSTVIDNQGSIISNNAYKIAAGANHLVILKKNGTTETIGQQTNSNLINVIDIYAGKSMTVYLTSDGKIYIMEESTLTELPLENIVYAELNGTKPYFLNYDRQLLYKDGTAVKAVGSELNKIREIKGDIALTEKNGIYNFGNTMNYVKTVEGTTIEIDSEEKALLDYRIYGNSIQSGTPSLDNPVEIESVGDKTINLFDADLMLVSSFATKAEDGKYLIERYPIPYYSEEIPGYDVPTEFVKQLKSVLKPNTTYTLSRKIENYSHGSVGRIVFTNNETWIAGVGYGNGLKLETFSLTQEQIDSINRVYVYGGDDDNPTIFSEIMLVEGEYTIDTLPAYEPYGKYKIPVTIKGKNLFNPNGDINRRATNEIPVFTQANILNGDGTINIQSSASSNYSVGQWIDVEVGKTYTVGGTLVSYGKVKNIPTITVEEEKENPNYERLVKINMPENNTTYSAVFTAQTNKVLLGFNKGIDAKYGDSGCLIKDVFFIEGEYDVGNLPTYEPYKETVTNIYLDEPLRKVGDYADYIDFKNGKVVRQVASKNLSEFSYKVFNNLVPESGQYRVGYFDINGDYSMLWGENLYGYCNVLPLSINWYGTAGREDIRFGQQNDVIYIYTNNPYETKEDLLNYLGNDAYVVYILATPIEESMDLPEIILNKGQNIIGVDATIQPSNILIEYNHKGSILD